MYMSFIQLSLFIYPFIILLASHKWECLNGNLKWYIFFFPKDNFLSTIRSSSSSSILSSGSGGGGGSSRSGGSGNVFEIVWIYTLNVFELKAESYIFSF